LIELQRWYSLDEIAKYLGVSKDTVHRWIRNKAMPAHKIGRLWKFKVIEVDKWVRNQQDYAKKTNV
jgi:excisionase family DNA binding protein